MPLITPPPAVNVGGKRIVVYIKEDLPGRLGEYDSEKRCINIAESVLEDPTLFRDTLVHEIIHCVLDLAGLSFNSSSVLSAKVEEQVVTAMETLASPAIAYAWNTTCICQ
tara:strand:+ start:759 stop:1088 length:330 start_codon:yes stop_codon:yes gene_type:complete